MNLNFSKIMPQQAHSKRTWRDRLPYLLAFFIPVLSMIMIFIGKEIYPFGDRSFCVLTCITNMHRFFKS